MELPTYRAEPKGVNPNVLLLYGTPKSGKTKITSQLEDSLILELEPGGGDFVPGRFMEINNPKDFNEALGLIESSPTKVCTYLIVDTITKLDEWSEYVGTYDYMEKAQGKKFNRFGEPGKETKITHKDPRFETVHVLPNGNGYQYSRNVMSTWYDRLLNLIPAGKVDHIILVAHIKDKMIETKRGDVVDAIDLNLTGKVRTNYAARVDAIGFFYRKDKQGILNFDNDYKVVCGGRCPHLDGEFVISEKMEDGTIKTYWDGIYLKS